MNHFRFRVLRPRQGEWVTTEAETIEDAIQDYHYLHSSITWADNSVGILLRNDDGTVREKQWFAVFETEDGEEIISRICVTGMWRKGGVRGPGSIRTLVDVARTLKIKPEDLKEGAWQGEEDYKQ